MNAPSYASPADLGGESMMSSKEIPHIELEPAVSLPDWMKKAKEEIVNSEEALADTHEHSDKNQDQLGVKMVSGEFHISLFLFVSYAHKSYNIEYKIQRYHMENEIT